MSIDANDERARDERPQVGGEETIRALVKRLSRHHSSGGDVIERAAIMAAGPDSVAILDWIEAHDGQPERLAVSASSAGGLHGGRLTGGRSSTPLAPQRYVLPPGALS
jgi:hypothetical protein